MTNRGLWALTSGLLSLATVSLLFGLSTYTINDATTLGVSLTAMLAVLCGLRAVSLPRKPKE